MRVVAKSTSLNMRWFSIILAALWSAAGVFAADTAPVDRSGGGAQKSAADYYVRNLPGLPADEAPIKMHAGHIEVDPEHNSNLFFWHFQNRHIAKKQRTVIWLNGGPGCSSEDGALMEIGPYRVNDDGSLRFNNGSWHEFANLIFIDNPVGTGFSFVNTDSYLHDLDQMAAHMIKFLGEFFKIFPEYESDDLYIAGESYAGQHIPYIGKAILDYNKDPNTKTKWNLAGLLIGNGWISPPEQYNAYASYALAAGLYKSGDSVDDNIKRLLKTCNEDMEKNPGHVGYDNCERVLGEILALTKTGTGDDACINMYDVRLKDSYPSCGMNWPPDLNNVTPYLRRDDVLLALNIDSRKTTGWSECKGVVGSKFRAQNTPPSVQLLPDILESTPILLFSGAKDLICNHMGTEKLISNLQWNGAKGMEESPGNWAPRRNWTVAGEDAGFWQSARKLTYVKFLDSSHMVPFDYPQRSLDMLNRFMEVDTASMAHELPDSLLEGDKKEPEHVDNGNDNKGNDGEKAGQQPADSVPEEETDEKVTKAKWEAYQKSGEIVLVILIVVVSVWGYFLWRQRRKQAVYSALGTSDGESRTNLRRKQNDRDLEASSFDETQLDDLHVRSPQLSSEGKYALDDESEEDEAQSGQSSRRD